MFSDQIINNFWSLKLIISETFSWSDIIYQKLINIYLILVIQSYYSIIRELWQKYHTVILTH